VDLPDAGKRSAKRILFLFENSFSESVEQSTEFLTERAKDSESKGMKVGSPPTFFDVILQHHYPSPVAYNFVIIQLELYIEVHRNCRSAQTFLQKNEQKKHVPFLPAVFTRTHTTRLSFGMLYGNVQYIACCRGI
jgi:hypothetical protein